MRADSRILTKMRGIWPLCAVLLLLPQLAYAKVAAPVEPGEEMIAPPKEPTDTTDPVGGDSLPPPEQPEANAKVLDVTSTGFLDSRTTFGRVAVNRLLPSNDLARLANLTEGNIQLKLHWAKSAMALVDASFLYQRGGMFLANDGAGNAVNPGDHDVPGLRPAAILSEMYATYEFGDHFNVTLGKKRVSWGSGLALSPADLLNPAKDPTDPTMQRAGSWLVRAEMPLDTFTFSLVAAGKVTRQFGGVPQSLVFYPDNVLTPSYDASGTAGADGSDNRPHFALAARAYALLAETDINAFYYMTQMYNDAFEYKNRGGLSLSHVFFNAVELHMEGIVQQGSSKLYFDSKCVDGGLTSVVGCLSQGSLPAERNKLADSDWRTKVLFGARYMFGDAASLTLEYYYNGEGYSPAEFDSYMRGVDLRRQAAAQNLPIPTNLLGNFGFAPSDPGSPQKFAFDPLRRHYALLSYQQAQIADDWTVMAVGILGLGDFSGTIAPQVLWSVREWLTLSVGAFVTLPGIASRGGITIGNEGFTEYNAQPSIFRAFGSGRLYF